jgi:hypothetical protein
VTHEHYLCVPAAAIIKDALAVRIDKQTGQVVIYPIADFRKVVEINVIAPIYWAMELVAAVAKDRASRGLKRWQPEEGVQGAVVFLVTNTIGFNPPHLRPGLTGDRDTYKLSLRQKQSHSDIQLPRLYFRTLTEQPPVPMNNFVSADRPFFASGIS